MSNIPNYNQWGKMNDYLNSIAVSLGSKVDTFTWAGVQKAVRLGLAPDLFPIGTQFAVNHSVYGTHLYDVVAHDYLKSAKNENAHTMTLLSHNVFGSIQYDEREAFYYADNELPAGTYNFTLLGGTGSWGAGTYQFTLSSALPKGGQLFISNDSATSLTAAVVLSYENRTSTVPNTGYPITLGEGGTSLGTFGVELNHIQRVVGGSNNYKESAIRQFLNSSAESGKVWSPQTKFDRPPSWVESATGFANGLDEDFLSIIGEVVVPCSANNIYESPDSTVTKGVGYTLRDKFYLPSHKEIFDNANNVGNDASTVFPYYEGSTNSDRIKYKNSVVSDWRTRTARGVSASTVNLVDSNGAELYTLAMRDRPCAVACTIV